jgi:integrase
VTESQNNGSRVAETAVNEVERAVERLCLLEETSAARARQLRWVAKELRIASAHPDFDPGVPVDHASDLLCAQAVTSYLELGRLGELRLRPTNRGDGTSSAASMRIREDCLRLICRELALPLHLTKKTPIQPPREVVDGPTRSQLRDYLARRAERPKAAQGQVRLLAIVGVVLDTGARVGELCAMRLEDLDLESPAPTIRVVRRPQTKALSEPVVEIIPITAGTLRAVKHWLEVRAEITTPLSIGVRELWVSVAGNHAGLPAADGHAIRRPAGMPLRPRGLQRAYTRTVVELNIELAGSPGWQPLPYRLEQLRRAIEVKPLETTAVA